MMMRTVTVVRQYLAPLFLIVIGLIVSGCGDTATVNPTSQLASLTVTTGTTTATLQPAFNPATTNYTVDLSNNITSVTVSAQPAVSGDTVSIDNQTTTSKVIDLGQPVLTGSTTPVSIAVSSPGTNPRTYTVSLVRAGLTGNNSLQSLTVSPGTLNPAFDANTQDYTINVANNVGSVSVTPTLDDPNATMTVNGQAAISAQPSTVTLGGPGSNTRIDIVVTAQNTSTKTYEVLVNRGGLPGNNNLGGLAVSPGSLSPSFNANVQAYTVDVDTNIGSIRITPTLSDTAATMTVNGQAATSGQASTVSLNGPGQSTAISIVVTAQNGSTKAYTVTVSRDGSSNNSLQSLAISPGRLSPSFQAPTTGYTVNLPATLPGNVVAVTVTPTLQDATASMTVNGQVATSGQAQTTPLPAPGSNTFINIVVIAQDGRPKAYSINVIRAALGGNNNLGSLTVSPGTLAPPFDPSVQTYTVDVDNNIDSVTVIPTLSDRAASMTINGQGTSSGQTSNISLGAEGSSTAVTIGVTAPNGNQKIYTVTVQRAASSSNNNLSALAVTPGSLAPAFDAATQTYSVDVTSDVTSVTVTATLADTNASMTINGQGTSSGQTSNISLGAEGSSTAVTIVVTAPNGSSKTYTVTANRAAAASAPPMPARAPDLIAQDDSCLPPKPPDPFDPNKCDPGSGTSRKDNITNITTPRFQISHPRTGETPNLYVDGTKVDSSFDPSTKTLKPTAALNDGGHTITYTVANAGAESPQSPPLMVIIDTVAPSSS